jgi:hypothetical protein
VAIGRPDSPGHDPQHDAPRRSPLAPPGLARPQLRLVTGSSGAGNADAAPALASMQAGSEWAPLIFSALHFIPCVRCGLELRRIVHGFATERAAGLFIVEQGWLDFAVYETRRLPEVLRE